MGVNLTPIIVRNTIRLKDIRGKSLAVDANNVLYQFLALIRARDTSPLKGPDGSITSHLVGLLYRTTHLVSRYHLTLVFIFDGKPHPLKREEIEKRRRLREKAVLEWIEAIREGDYVRAFSKAVMTGTLTRRMIEDAKKLLDLLGVPWVQAPAEAEAQAAYMAMKGDVWASSSRDYDSLLFGAPRLIRYLTISGKEFLPSKGISRPLKPELIILEDFLSKIKITREQLIDLAILIGTDFNEGIKGIGPKKALKLLRKYSKIENLPREIRDKVPLTTMGNVIEINPFYKKLDKRDFCRLLEYLRHLYGNIQIYMLTYGSDPIIKVLEELGFRCRLGAYVMYTNVANGVL